jgi:predicted ATPase/DNA-binding SARP family transcriptional activator/Tfp pilus assembly protein PilF
MQTLWHIELFGHLRVTAGQVVHTRFYSQKAVSLLARLAYFSGRSLSREEACEFLWPESDSKAGRVNMRTVLSSLRRQLEPPGIPAGSVVIADYTHLRLNPTTFTTDVEQFAAALTAIERATNDDDRDHACAAAYRLYRGELLPGLYDDWVIQERLYREQQFHGLIRRLCDRAEGRGDLSTAGELALRLAAFTPSDEQAQIVALRLLCAAGHRTSAQEHYDFLWRIYREQSDEEPPATLQQVAQSFSLQTPSPRRGKSRPLRPVGKGVVLSTDEIVSKSVASEEQEEQRIEKEIPELPLTLTRFFGREEEVQTLRHWLTRPETRLVTITGVGGVGKTRLAIEVARAEKGQAQTDSPAGIGRVRFVSLAEVPQGVSLLERICAVCSLRLVSDHDLLDRLQRTLSEHPTLLLLDNFEHLVEDGTETVLTLLERVPALRCLITSRHRLDCEGEQEFPLTPLPVPPSALSPEEIMSFPVAQLLVDRAQANRPDFQITVRNAPAVTAVCQQLEGLPLAVELAAARLQVVTAAQMEVELKSRFTFLVSRRRGIAPRQQSLRATLDWSYQLLTPELQRFLARLSVFRGGWIMEAARDVCDEPEALTRLEDLRASSLLLTTESDAGIRFTLLETVREYAAEKLAESGETDHWRERHWQYFTRVAQQGEGHPITDQTQWLDRLEIEHDNLRGAAMWCQDCRTRQEKGLELTAAAWRFWLRRGHLTEGKKWLAAFVPETQITTTTATEEPIEEPIADSAVLSGVLRGVGELAWASGDFEAARIALENSLAMAQRMADERCIAGALQGLGATLQSQGAFDEARIRLEEALTRYRALGDDSGTAAVLNSLANTYLEQGEYHRCESLYRESQSLYLRVGDRIQAAGLLANLCLLCAKLGDTKKAITAHREALAQFRALKEKRGMAVTLNLLGTILCEQGALTESIAVLEESLQLFREIGNPLRVATVITNLAIAHDLCGDAAMAEQLTRDALAIEREYQSVQGVAFSLCSLAGFLRDRGAFAESEAAYSESLTLFEASAIRIGIASALGGQSQLRYQQEDIETAYQLAREGLRYWRATGLSYKPGVLECLETLAGVAGNCAETERCAVLYGGIDALRTVTGIPLSPRHRERYEGKKSAAQASLQTSEPPSTQPSWQQHYQQGGVLSWESLVDYALA